MDAIGTRTDPVDDGDLHLVVLIDRVSDADRAAFESLYRLTSGIVFGCLLATLCRQSWAEDVLQDTFAAVWQGSERYDARLGSPLDWICAVALQRATAFLFRHRREARRLLAEDGGAAIDGTPMASSEDRRPFLRWALAKTRGTD